jgi:hypothetical protein
VTGPHRMTGPAPDAPVPDPLEPDPIVEPGPEVSPDDGDEGEEQIEGEDTDVPDAPGSFAADRI